MTPFDITMTATVRPMVVAWTLDTFCRYMLRSDQRKLCRLILNVDPAGEDVDPLSVLDMAKDYFEEIIYRVPEKPNWAAAIKWTWSQTRTPYVLHMEDDWTMAYEMPVDALLTVMRARRRIAWLGLNRWNNPETHPSVARFLPLWHEHWFERFGEYPLSFAPAMMRGKFARAFAALMDTERNPESQIAAPRRPMLRLMRQWRYGTYADKDSLRCLGNIGWRWRDAYGFAQPARDFVTWTRKRRVQLNGHSFYVAAGPDEYWSDYEAGKWEPRTLAVFDRFIEPGRAMLDVGAWVGGTALYARQLTDRVYALEPDPTAYAMLDANREANFDRPRTYEMGLADRCGKMFLGNHQGLGNRRSSLLFGDAPHQAQVICLTLPEFAKRQGIEDVGFIKMDTEGGELLILPAAKEWLAKHKPTLMLSIHTGKMPDARAGLETVLGVLSVYKHLYKDNGTEIDADWLREYKADGNFNAAVIATDREWNV